jgi:hypothetical protein
MVANKSYDSTPKSPHAGKISAFDFEAKRLKEEEMFLARKKVEAKKMQRNMRSCQETIKYFIAQN